MKHLVTVIPFIGLLATAPASLAADYVWTGTASGSMNDTANYVDEFGGIPASLPTVGDLILFTNAVNLVANMPVNTLSSARFGNLRFDTDGYTLASTADLFYKRIVVAPGVTVTNVATLAWDVNEGSRVEVQSAGKFIHNGNFGSRQGDFFMQFGANAEFIFMRGGANSKVKDSWNSYTVTLDTSVNNYLELAGTCRLRTTGGDYTLGNSKTRWQQGNNIYFGGAGSGNITKTGEFEIEWGGPRNFYVEDIVLKVDNLNTAHERNSGTESFNKYGNGVLTFTGNSTFSQNADSNKNGLRLRVAEGTMCVNASFVNYSRTQNNIEGLVVESGARLEGVGTFNTVASVEGYRKTAVIRGTLAPGCTHMDDTKHVGTLTLRTAAFTFENSAHLEIKAGRDAHDTLALDATLININSNATLDILPLDSATATAPFIILDNQGPAPINGTFFGLPEGAKVVATGDTFVKRYTLTYVGGDGNDIVLNPISDNTLFLVR